MDGDLLSPDPVEIYGQLTEGVFLAGFTFERACQHLETLLAGDGWRLGGRYEDVNAFLGGIRLDQFRAVAEARKRIATRIKQLQPKASNRQIAMTLGVSEGTVRNDTAQNYARPSEKPTETASSNGDGAQNYAPSPLTGAVAAQAVAKVAARDAKEADIRRQRADFEARRDEGASVNDLVALAMLGRRFPVIYADPPWEFKVYSGKGKQRSAERHYDTLSLDAIKMLPVEPLAADDCALFLWAVWPELPGALDIIKAWGFEYKTAGFVWVKQVSGTNSTPFTGMGYWTRANSEVCLFATRGSPQRAARDVHQVIQAPVGEHSAKPEEARARIERLIIGPYLELFARRPAPGWLGWGNEMAPE